MPAPLAQSRPLSPVPAGPRAQEGGQGAGALDVLAVRAWARSRGYPIDESGSIPLTVLRTYRRLHPC